MMINLRDVVYYENIEDTVVEIFEKYQYALIRLGLTEGSIDLFEAIVFCPSGLEGILESVCAWCFIKQQQGEVISLQTLEKILKKAIVQQWKPTSYQKRFLQRHPELLETPKEYLWRNLGESLGNELRDKLIHDISETGNIIYTDNAYLYFTSEVSQKISQVLASAHDKSSRSELNC